MTESNESKRHHLTSAQRRYIDTVHAGQAKEHLANVAWQEGREVLSEKFQEQADARYAEAKAIRTAAIIRGTWGMSVSKGDIQCDESKCT